MESVSELGLEQVVVRPLWLSLGHTSLLLCLIRKMLQKFSSVLI